jgi:2-phosphosulfolactate phosphatase
MMTLKAHFLPDLTAPEKLAGGAVVVIDVLRATTVIAHALAAGAREVIPCLEVDEALRIAQDLPKGQAVLAGERDGMKIDGFDLGNSPAEFTPESVEGKIVVFTTTNGTRAMTYCRDARRVLTGAFVNGSAVIEALSGEDHIHLLCAGTRREVTREDVLFAGFVADGLLLRLGDAVGPAPEINDELRIARDCWQAARADCGGLRVVDSLSLTLRSTQGGRNLKKIGLEHDIELAARLDRFAIVPELQVRPWRIVLP